MRVVIIGATGTIGKKLVDFFSKDHELIKAHRSDSSFPVDITSKDSMLRLFEKTGRVDGIICVAGEAKWNRFYEMNEDDFYVGIRSKLMGQVNLVRIGLDFLNPGGSITLTTGILADHPVPMTTSAAMVNGAIHSFVKALDKEDLNGRRVNVVAAPLVEDSIGKYEKFFKGQPVIGMDPLAKAYEKSLVNTDSGKIYRLY
jgi:NAD(P)-dependent dehydrogenase (short-subunit alcohol dehydrogenase family)